MKGLGYLISTLSVILLGAVAWPKPDEPAWKAGTLVAGIVASIVGMLLRYLSHRKEKAAIAYATREAEKHSRRGTAYRSPYEGAVGTPALCNRYFKPKVELARLNHRCSLKRSASQEIAVGNSSQYSERSAAQLVHTRTVSGPTSTTPAGRASCFHTCYGLGHSNGPIVTLANRAPLRSW